MDSFRANLFGFLGRTSCLLRALTQALPEGVPLQSSPLSGKLLDTFFQEARLTGKDDLSKLLERPSQRAPAFADAMARQVECAEREGPI
jgi:hypothetical protein